MSIVNVILSKVAKPPAPETQCVRLADLARLAEVPGLGVTGDEFVHSLSADMLVAAPSGEALCPASYFGAVAAKNPVEFFGVDRVYPVDEEHCQEEREVRQPAIRLSPEQAKEAQNSASLKNAYVEGPEGTGFLLCDALPKAFQVNKPDTSINVAYTKTSQDRDLRSYSELSSLQKNLLGSEDYGQKRWASEFSPRQMKAFLVLTDLWEHPEKIDSYSQNKGQKPLDAATLESLRVTADDLQGLTLGSIHSDRKHFEITFAGAPADLERLQSIFGDAQTDGKGEQTERGFLADPPFKPFHPDTQEGGGRSPNSHYSLQFMIGQESGAGDIDMFNPLVLPSETSKSDRRRAFVRHWAKHWGEIIGGKNLLPDYMKPDKLATQLGITLWSERAGQ